MNFYFHRILAVIIVLILSGLITSALAASQDPQPEVIVVAEGTPINVVTAQEITSKEAKPNDNVNFTVNEDVVVNGHVVVRKGAAAVGSVINAEKGGYMGKSGKLAIQVEYTQTVNDQRLKLRAAKGREGNDKTTSTFALSMISPFFLFKKGGEAKIAAGTPVTVYVAEEKRFRLDGSTLVAIVSEKPASEDATEATVYVYRPKKMVGGALEPSVFVDDIELGRMDNGRYFAFKMKPGKHIVRMTDQKKAYAIDMGPGQTYYFRVGIEAGMWKGHGKLTLDDAERAIQEIKKLKFLGQDKIKASTLVIEISPE